MESSRFPEVGEFVESLCCHADPCGDFVDVAEAAKIFEVVHHSCAFPLTGVFIVLRVLSFTSLVLVGCILRLAISAVLSTLSVLFSSSWLLY